MLLTIKVNGNSTAINIEDDENYFVQETENENAENLENLTVAQQLADYKARNPIIQMLLNFAFIKDSQIMLLKTNFKNSQGITKISRFLLRINSIGLKTEFAFKIHFVYLLGQGANFYDMSKEIELGFGIDIRSPLLDITYAPFKEVEGGVLILAVPITDILWITNIIANKMNKFAKEKREPDLFNLIYTTYEERYNENPLLLLLPPFGFGMGIVTGGSITPIELF